MKKSDLYSWLLINVHLNKHFNFHLNIQRFNIQLTSICKIRAKNYNLVKILSRSIYLGNKINIDHYFESNMTIHLQDTDTLQYIHSDENEIQMR